MGKERKGTGLGAWPFSTKASIFIFRFWARITSCWGRRPFPRRLTTKEQGIEGRRQCELLQCELRAFGARRGGARIAAFGVGPVLAPGCPRVPRETRSTRTPLSTSAELVGRGTRGDVLRGRAGRAVGWPGYSLPALHRPSLSRSWGPASFRNAGRRFRPVAPAAARSTYTDSQATPGSRFSQGGIPRILTRRCRPRIVPA